MAMEKEEQTIAKESKLWADEKGMVLEPPKTAPTPSWFTPKRYFSVLLFKGFPMFGFLNFDVQNTLKFTSL